MTVHRSSLRCLLVFGVALTVWTSCNWFQEHEYLRITVINETGEDLVVQTGLDFVTQTVLEDSRMVVSVVKGAEITARGKTTGKQYGPVEFQYDADWFVLPV